MTIANKHVVTHAIAFVEGRRAADHETQGTAACIKAILEGGKPDAQLGIFANTIVDTCIDDKEGKLRIKDFRKEMKRQALKILKLDQYPTVKLAGDGKTYYTEWKTVAAKDELWGEVCKAHSANREPSPDTIAEYNRLMQAYTQAIADSALETAIINAENLQQDKDTMTALLPTTSPATLEVVANNTDTLEIEEKQVANG